MTTNNISKKRKFVADGVFYAELNEVSTLEVPALNCQHKCVSVVEGEGELRAVLILPVAHACLYLAAAHP